MRAWQFSRPKGPGFGISAGYYLTVLSSRPVLPSLLQIIAPKGENGAIEGFGVPLGTKEREALAQPMSRGAYALASKDRKTVIKVLVLSKEEACFDPEPFVRSSLAADAEPELIARVRSTWTVLQLSFESHDPAVYPAVRFMLGIAKRTADLTEGVVADPISRRYLLPDEVFHSAASSITIDARDVIAVSREDRPDGAHLFTLGLQKFALPEYELYGVEPHAEALAAAFLIGLAQTTLLGDLAHPGGAAGSSTMPFEIRSGGLDRAMWEGVDCYELLPPTQHTSAEALLAWSEEQGLPR